MKKLWRYYWPDRPEWSANERASRRFFAFVELVSGIVALAAVAFGSGTYLETPLEIVLTLLIGIVSLIVPIVVFNIRAYRIPISLMIGVGSIVLASICLQDGLSSAAGPSMVLLVLGATLMLGTRGGAIATAFAVGVMVLSYTRAHSPSVLAATGGLSAEGSSFELLQVLCVVACFTFLFSAFFVREMKQAAVQLGRERKKAMAADRAKSEFLANMSHEIRTPMNGVLGMAELMLQTPLDKQQKVFAETIYNSGHALLTIINDILDFSKIEAGRLELDPVPFDLTQQVEDVASLLGATARRKGIELMVRVRPTVPRGVVGDPGRFRQVLMNLAGNAVKFTHDGNVLIDVDGGVRDGIADLVIRVEDSGIGIPPDKLAHIFDKFVQAEGSTQRQYGGTGLGLAISKSFVEIMGGRIGVSSVVGRGSVFQIDISLPVHDLGEQVKLEPTLRSRRILAVDDNDTNRLILAENIERWGGQPVLAESAVTGLELIKAAAAAGSPFDMVISDFQMPGVDGLEFLKWIRSAEEIADTKVLVLSSIGDSELSQQLRALGVVDILTKPCRAVHLRHAIGTALSLPAGEETSDALAPATEISRPGADAIRSRILVAEDNVVNRMVLENMIPSNEHDVVFAENGKEAFDLVRAERFDLIFMDISMPVMDGVQACKAIRLHEAGYGLAPTPIVALTAHAMKGDRARLIDEGMDDYLSKPVKFDEVTEMIRKWTNNHSEQADDLSGAVSP